MGQHGGGNISNWVAFLLQRGNLVRVARKTNEGKDRAVLEEKMLSKRLETGLEVPLLVKQQT